MILFWTVSFCLGWRIITDEGQILYFIRKFFEDNQSDWEYKEERIKLLEKSSDLNLRNQVLRHKLINFIGTPFVLCITCMASIWGVTIYLLLADTFSWTNLVLNCISASFIQTFIWKLYVKLD